MSDTKVDATVTEIRQAIEHLKAAIAHTDLPENRRGEDERRVMAMISDGRRRGPRRKAIPK